MVNAQISPHFGLHSCLQYFLNILYILCFCPFRLKVYHENGAVTRFKKEKWWFQSACHILLAILATLYCVKDLRFTAWNSRNPDQYFRIVYKITILPSVVHFATCFWTSPESFVNIVNFIINSKNNCLPSPSGKHTVTLTILFIAFAGVFVGNGFVTLFVGNYGSFTGPTNISWWTIMVHEGQLEIFLDSREPLNYPTEVVFGIIGITGIFYRSLLDYWLLFRLLVYMSFRTKNILLFRRRMSLIFGKVFLLLTSVIFWGTTRAFAGNLRVMIRKPALTIFNLRNIVTTPTSEWTHVQAEYCSILKLSRMLNPLIGIQHTLCLVAHMFYYGAAFARITDWISFKEDVCYFSMPVVILLVAASGAYQVPE